jgi:hypothetical protein
LTRNSGGTWTDISGTAAGNSIPDMPVYGALFVDDFVAATSTLVIATEGGVFSTATPSLPVASGLSWDAVQNGLPLIRCQQVIGQSIGNGAARLRVGTFGRGVFEWTDALGATACGDVRQPCCPSGCKSGASCVSGTCVACLPAHRIVAVTTEHNGADCGGTNHSSDFGSAHCDLGFVLESCGAVLVSDNNGSTCSAAPSRNGGCLCTATVTTPGDCTKWATCSVTATEKPAAPNPSGCR